MGVIDLQNDYPDWPTCFKDLKAKKIQFVLYFDSINDKSSHGICGVFGPVCLNVAQFSATLKFCETYYKVLTQHVTLEKAQEAEET